MNEQIISQINKMPESLKSQLLTYAEFLLSKYKKGDKKKAAFGSAKDKYILSANFNEPLKDFEEYQ